MQSCIYLLLKNRTYCLRQSRSILFTPSQVRVAPVMASQRFSALTSGSFPLFSTRIPIDPVSSKILFVRIAFESPRIL